MMLMQGLILWVLKMRRLTRFERNAIIAILIMMFIQTVIALLIYELVEFEFAHDLQGVGWYIKRFIEDYGNYLGLG